MQRFDFLLITECKRECMRKLENFIYKNNINWEFIFALQSHNFSELCFGLFISLP